MLYKSLNNFKHRVSFEEALFKGLAPDKGLYFPVYIPKLKNIFIKNLIFKKKKTIATEIIKPFLKNEINEKKLFKIISDTLKFSFPLKEINDNIYSLELFHGPTMAFKDIGAKFMSNCLKHFLKKKKNYNTILILVATSGDTGGAVSNAFYDIENIKVVILYPSKKISKLQEKQFSTLGKNINALEIQGSFDDCQNLVKKAFLDKNLKKKYFITSANSINIARLLPQMFYYFFSYRNIKRKYNNSEIIFSIPSGNFGNICAGILAYKMGLPIKHLIASTNQNNTIHRFLKTGKYKPYPTLSTLSNAMDISDPSNFIRIKHIYKNFFFLKKKMSSYYFSDESTLKIIKNIWKKYKYILDPHGAIGYLGLKKYFYFYKKNYNTIGIFLETAHPIKFSEKIPKYIRNNIFCSKKINFFLKKKKKSILLSNNYFSFKKWLLNNI